MAFDLSDVFWFSLEHNNQSNQVRRRDKILMMSSFQNSKNVVKKDNYSGVVVVRFKKEVEVRKNER